MRLITMKDQTKGCSAIIAALLFTLSSLITFSAVWSGLVHGRGWSFLGAGAATFVSSIVPGVWAWLGATGAQSAWGWPALVAWLACLPSQGVWLIWLIAGLRERATTNHRG